MNIYKKYLLGSLYLGLSFFWYLFFYQNTVIRNCDWIKGGVGAWYICSGYFAIYEKISFPLYLIFLLVSIYIYIKNNSSIFNKKIITVIKFISFFIVLYILFISLTTSTEFANGLPMNFKR